MLRSTEVHPDCDEFATLKKNRETWFQEQKRLQISATSFFFPIEPSGVLFFFAFSHLWFFLFFTNPPFPLFLFPPFLFVLFPVLSFFFVSLFPCSLVPFLSISLHVFFFCSSFCLLVLIVFFSMFFFSVFPLS